ncbi:DUF262 domain-containing protein [Pedobacter sp. SYSU D00535]|uniref:DUF262 domain-containing protein n=1 Tax=Pedobacter sp. SYSU D00535 TaxID=2810308 RepID=UPI001A960377|nr:DUF262 domain-containing protein [Pedobacter sp. SYSU D00535]
MKADALSLAATLNSSEVDVYTIPQYQRPYTWNTENYEVLWEDLSDAYAEYLKALEENRTPDYYFLGPVVFVKNSLKRSFDIIDGQQRSTTFHVILWYLYKRLTDETEKARIHQILTFLGKEAKLKVSAKDAPVYLKIMQSADALEGNSQMVESANYFRSKINELLSPDSFSAFLREYTQFIVIVADDYGKAWDLFIGLNGKGEPLNPTDLVKAYVCGRSDIGEQAGQIWEEKILPLKADSTAYLLFLARYKAKKFVTENALFKEITKLYPTTITTLDISENSEIFHWFWHVDIDGIPKHFSDGLNITSDGRKALRVLRDLGRRDFSSLLFQYAAAFGKKSIFDEAFLRMLASYQIRMAISRKRSRERKFVGWFSSIDFSRSEDGDPVDENEAQKIRKCRANTIIARILRADAPDDATFETLVKISGYHGNYPARIILRHHEEGERGNRTILDYQLEHLMPQTGTDYWYAEAAVIDENGEIDTNAYNNIVNNIGNLFVIDPTTNNEVKNFDYGVKKSFYQEHLKDWSIARITADPRNNWRRTDIEDRAGEIAYWAKEYWSL